MQTLLIINTAPDTVTLLTALFEQFGFVVVSCYTHDIRSGRSDLGQLIRQHAPKAVIYDVAPPYLRNWRFFEHLRSSLLAGLPVELTSTNTAITKSISGTDEDVYEVLETPSELQKILSAVRRATEK